jgi:hypothetical protein
MMLKPVFPLLYTVGICIAVTLSACSTKYTVPAEKSTAYIHVVDTNNEPDKTAFIATYQEAESCKQRLWLQQGRYIPGDITASVEKIEAGKPISISIHGSTMSPACVSTFNFTPEAGRYYRAKKNGCNTVLLESSVANDFSVKRDEEVLLMDFKKAFSESGSWCSVSPLNQLKKQ